MVTVALCRRCCVRSAQFASTVRLASSSATNSRRRLPCSFSEAGLNILGEGYATDDWTNVSSMVVKLSQRRLLKQRGHPLNLVKRRIVDHFYDLYRKAGSTSPMFSVHENFHPVVSLWENFDSLLIAADHVSRRTSDTYYVNAERVLRTHTSAHQHSLISAGRDCFLVVGDVYRRDEIDRSHFPAFHQMEGVRLFSRNELFGAEKETDSQPALFDQSETRTADKQALLTRDASQLLEINLKETLETLARRLFSNEVTCRWVETYFPFTHPSWELEVKQGEAWIETLGCGIIEQRILDSAGAGGKVGWAFGLGLERLAMKLYSIPDIRLFWSRDTGFLSQFQLAAPDDDVTYQAISRHPQCVLDLSFWLPATENNGNGQELSSSDVYEIIREIGSDLVEQVKLEDDYVHPKTGRRSQCYRIVYRHYKRPLRKQEVNGIHAKIGAKLVAEMNVEIR